MTKEQTNWEEQISEWFNFKPSSLGGELSMGRFEKQEVINFIKDVISQETKRLQEKIKELEKDKYGLQQWFDDLPEKRYDPEVKWRVSKQELEELLVNRISQEREKWIEGLTEKLDMEKMLPGWERYWKEVRPGRFVCTCGECENGDKIINLLENN